LLVGVASVVVKPFLLSVVEYLEGDQAPKYYSTTDGFLTPGRYRLYVAIITICRNEIRLC